MAMRSGEAAGVTGAADATCWTTSAEVAEPAEVAAAKGLAAVAGPSEGAPASGPASSVAADVEGLEEESAVGSVPGGVLGIGPVPLAVNMPG